jgi:hypothetical protein
VEAWCAYPRRAGRHHHSFQERSSLRLGPYRDQVFSRGVPLGRSKDEFRFVDRSLHRQAEIAVGQEQVRPPRPHVRGLHEHELVARQRRREGRIRIGEEHRDQSFELLRALP